jgi:hypothetical protein
MIGLVDNLGGTSETNNKKNSSLSGLLSMFSRPS